MNIPVKHPRNFKATWAPVALILSASLLFACGSMSSGSSPGTSGGDATVSGTNYNATGNIPCSMGNGQPTTNCNFGVVRRGNGDADVHVTRPNGAMRVIYFQNGQAVGYDKSQADRGEFRSTKESSLYIIHIGSERYEIPEAVVYGG